LNKAVVKLSDHLAENVETISRMEKYVEHIVVVEQQTREAIDTMTEHLIHWRQDIEMQINLAALGIFNAVNAQRYTEEAVKASYFHSFSNFNFYIF